MIVGGEPEIRLKEIIDRLERAAKEARLSAEDTEAFKEVIEDWKELGADKLYRFASSDTWNFPLYLAIMSAAQNRRELNSLKRIVTEVTTRK